MDNIIDELFYLNIVVEDMDYYYELLERDENGEREEKFKYSV